VCDRDAAQTYHTYQTVAPGDAIEAWPRFHGSRLAAPASQVDECAT